LSPREPRPTVRPWAIVRHVDIVLDDSYLSLSALSKYSGLSVTTLRRQLVADVDPLPACRVERRIVVRKSAFDAWMLRRETLGDQKLDRALAVVQNARATLRRAGPSTHRPALQGSSASSSE
jgi:hypothetical protein